MTTPLLDVKDLAISLPFNADRKYAIEHVNVTLQKGEILCIVGESGSGKSMLARAILGLLPGSGIDICQGEILFDGQDLATTASANMRALRGSRIAMVFQEPMTALNPVLRIGDQIDEVLREHSDMSSKQRKNRILEILTDVQLPNPAQIYNAYPHQLSGGQRQRAMIAMALILDPEIIIADEPTTALDVSTQAQVLSLMKDIQQKHGTGILFITHDFGVVAEIADRIIVMQSGHVVETGTCDEILNNPAHPYTKTLIAAVPGFSFTKTALPKQASRPAMEVVALEKTFRSSSGLFGRKRREVIAVDNISLRLYPGETLGIIGESGSGKSTLARLIIRIINADDGAVLIRDQDFLALSPSRLAAARKQIQMIFQDPFASLNPRRQIRRIIGEGLYQAGKSGAFIEERVSALLELVGLSHEAGNRYPHEFSGGQRQRIGIARALAMEPDILIADEVVSALDVSVQKQVLALLQEIQDRLGLAMLFITHDLCVAAQICDKIAVMRHGKIVEMGKTRDILEHPTHDYTRALLDAIPGRSWLERRQQSDIPQNASGI